MAKVELNPTPTAQIVAKAQSEVVLPPDDKGRVFTLRKPGALAQFRLVEALGDTASNQTYMGMVLPLIYLAKIDGEDVLPPISKREVEALIQRLDDEGIAALHAGVRDNYGTRDAEADKAALKN